MNNEPNTFDPDKAQQLEDAIALVVSNPDAFAEAVSRACPDGVRHDGWTPFARKLFLQVLADTGRISFACQCAGLSTTSAHNLRARDPMFAAGWDAACLFARQPLADQVYEQSVEGVTETITRNGEVVATRHRFDTRLSMAVLHRLDKRCDRVEEQGGPNLALMRNWDEWLTLIGKGEDQAAGALLETAAAEDARQRQLRQLPAAAEPAPEPEAAAAPQAAALLPGIDESDSCWQDEQGRWLTTFPPPPGFVGYQKGEVRGLDYYERACTPEEAEALDASIAAEDEEMLAEQERARDAWFARLRQESAAALAEARPAPADAIANASTTGNFVNFAPQDEPRTPDCGNPAPPVEPDE